MAESTRATEVADKEDSSLLCDYDASELGSSVVLGVQVFGGGYWPQYGGEIQIPVGDRIQTRQGVYQCWLLLAATAYSALFDTVTWLVL